MRGVAANCLPPAAVPGGRQRSGAACSLTIKSGGSARLLDNLTSHCASISMRIHYAHSKCGSFTMGAKKAVNVSIQSELLDAARAEDINLSATLEAALADQLRIRRRDRWQTENEAAIEAYNRDVDQNSSFGDHARSF